MKTDRRTPTYGQVHGRLRQLRGPARDYPCVECGDPAAQWAYDHSDPDFLVEWLEGRPVTYGSDPKFYRPMCMRCHTLMDKREYRARRENPSPLWIRRAMESWHADKPGCRWRTPRPNPWEWLIAMIPTGRLF